MKLSKDESEWPDIFADCWQKDEKCPKLLTNVTFYMRDGILKAHAALLLKAFPRLVGSTSDMSFILPDECVDTLSILLELVYTGQSLVHDDNMVGRVEKLAKILGFPFENITKETVDITLTEAALQESEPLLESPHENEETHQQSDTQSNQFTEGQVRREMEEPMDEIGQNHQANQSFDETIVKEENLSGFESEAMQCQETPDKNDSSLDISNASSSKSPHKRNARAEGSRTCKICHKKLPNESTLRSHLTIKHYQAEIRQLFIQEYDTVSGRCRLCQISMKTECSFLNHIGAKHKMVLPLYERDLPTMNQETVPSTPMVHNEAVVSTPRKRKVQDSPSNCNSCETQGSVKKRGRQKSNREPCPIPCPICGEGGSHTISQLLQHLSSVHFRTKIMDNFGNYYTESDNSCGLCGKALKNKVGFIVHIGATHRKVCTILTQEGIVLEGFDEAVSKSQCKKVAPVKPSLQRKSPCPSAPQESSHKNVACEVCGTASKSKLHNTMHLIEHFKDELIFEYWDAFVANNKQCQICGLAFTTQNGYISHIGVVHQKVLPLLHKKMAAKNKSANSTMTNDSDESYECDQCKEVFEVKDKLTSHLIRMHFREQMEKSFLQTLRTNEMKCWICSYSEVFSDPMMAFEHLGIAHNILDDMKSCSNQAVEESEADQEPYSCPTCFFTDKNKKVIQDHLIHSHHLEQLEKKYSNQCFDSQCFFCDEKFNDNPSLLWHIGIDHRKVLNFVPPPKRAAYLRCLPTMTNE